MFKQLFIVLALVSVVLCQEGEEVSSHQDEQSPSTAQETDSTKPNTNLGTGLLDLALIAEKNTRRAFDESKPTLNHIKNSLQKSINNIKNNPQLRQPLEGISTNPNIKKGLDTVKQSVEKLNTQILSNPFIKTAQNKTRPIVEQSMTGLNKFVGKVEQRGRAVHDKLLAEHEARQRALNA